MDMRERALDLEVLMNPVVRWMTARFVGIAMSVTAMQIVAQAPGSAPSPSEHRVPRLIPRTSAEREQRFVTQHRIILNVHVADASGGPQPALNETDFTLYDNDQPRKLVSFRSVDGNSGGAHVILVIDAVNNFTRQLHFYEKEIESFLKKSSDPLPVPVAIGVFAGYSINVGQSSRDRSALLAELTAKVPDLRTTGCITQQDHSARMNAPFTAGGVGGERAQSSQELACKNDRFVQSVNALSQLARKEVDVPGRLVLVWLGPGWPMLTDRAFSPDPPDLKRNFFEQLVVLSTALREAQVTVDAVASPDDSINPDTPNVRDSAFFNGVADEDQVSAAQFGLHVLAHQTGGKIVPETRDVPGQIDACIAEAESYYVLAFDSPRAANFGEYHALALKVDKPGLDVRTNTLYYAEQ
jgi:VWFA-related protein